MTRLKTAAKETMMLLAVGSLGRVVICCGD